MYQELSFLVRR